MTGGIPVQQIIHNKIPHLPHIREGPGQRTLAGDKGILLFVPEHNFLVNSL